MRRHHPLLLLITTLLIVWAGVSLAHAHLVHAADFDLEMNGTSLSLCHTISDLPARCQRLF